MKAESLDYSAYCSVVKEYGKKGCFTNDYLFSEARYLAEKGLLSALVGKENAFIFVDKGLYKRAYCYINDYEEIMTFDNGTVTTELLYRSNTDEPRRVIDYLQECGMTRHILRDQYSATSRSSVLKVAYVSDYVREANDIEEIKWACNLFNNTFDTYTGDYITKDEYSRLLERKDIILAFDPDRNEPLGALHRTLSGCTVWLSHIAVLPEARGKGIGKNLVDSFILRNLLNDRTRFMLWVQHNNTSALNLYTSAGFLPTDKSSLSMIKY